MHAELISKFIPIAFADPLALCLVQAGVIDEYSIKAAIEGAKKNQQSLIGFLIDQKLVDCKAMAKALAEHLRLEYVDLSGISQEHLLKDFIDSQFIRELGVLPLKIVDQQLHLAISEPKHLEALSELKFHTDLPVKAVIVDGDKLRRLIDNFLSEQNYQLLSHFNFSTINHGANDQRITEFVKQIIFDAIKKRASDIHLEPYTTSYRIRLRIDGILHKMALFSLDVANRITATIKVLANLDIAERRLPQDGRFTIEINPQSSRDCRVSSCPTLYGEKIVIRILDAENISLNIDELGMEQEQSQCFLNAIQRPQGMVLVTGPTGSGKTITLYAALHRLNTLDKNIVTVEEPVEIKLPGINQVNVNPKAELTFSKVLRAFLRQDPDILMLGEIRDKETADIALKAAQTGHLLLSTLHTNSATETLLRLLMMDIPAFTIAHSVHLIVAQRLLRKLCQYCKLAKIVSQEELQQFGFSIKEKHLTIYQAIGCDRCNKGYTGRLAVFEMLPITIEISQLILQSASMVDIAQAAQKLGYINLCQAAMNKVKIGLTSLTELQRVIV